MREWLSKFRNQREYGLWKIRELTIDDKEIYSIYIKMTEYPASCWSSNFSYLWAYTNSNKLHIYKALIDGWLVTFILTHKGRLYLPTLPYGKGDVEELTHVLIKCSEFCLRWNKDSEYEHMSTVNPLNEAQYDFLQTSRKFHEYFRFEKLSGLERHYSISKLIDLKGKDFANIRNKLNSFKRNYGSAIIRRYRENDFEEVMKLGKQWEMTSGQKYNRLLDEFYFESLVRNYKKLGHIILVVEYNQKIIGMTTAEILPTRQAWGCITKFDNAYKGLSEFLTVEVAKEIHKLNPYVEYINVGSDLGSEGLAFFKERFRPVYSYKRFCIFFKQET